MHPDVHRGLHAEELRPMFYQRSGRTLVGYESHHRSPVVFQTGKPQQRVFGLHGFHSEALAGMKGTVVDKSIFDALIQGDGPHPGIEQLGKHQPLPVGIMPEDHDMVSARGEHLFKLLGIFIPQTFLGLLGRKRKHLQGLEHRIGKPPVKPPGHLPTPCRRLLRETKPKIVQHGLPPVTHHIAQYPRRHIRQRVDKPERHPRNSFEQVISYLGQHETLFAGEGQI